MKLKNPHKTAYAFKGYVFPPGQAVDVTGMPQARIDWLMVTLGYVEVKPVGRPKKETPPPKPPDPPKPPAEPVAKTKSKRGR